MSLGIEMVDITDREVQREVLALMRRIFHGRLPWLRNWDWRCGDWRLVFDQEAVHPFRPVAFAGARNSPWVRHAAHIVGVGVLPAYRGQGLQCRLLNKLAAAAETRECRSMIAETDTSNWISSNNFVRAGYQIFWPRSPWCVRETIYWRRYL